MQPMARESDVSSAFVAPQFPGGLKAAAVDHRMLPQLIRSA
ncbi:hypothetical protein ALQ93_101337 [Pseudomonas syringae pv. pisi]|uniref:Uncharacterized protein n=7 Tax=Pseudomonas syringae group TaxID=136849 RepID=A0A0P9UXX9_9PSED|nr:hypothetical protein ALO90_101670 [Pseudomonas amygdali pv. aesculi]KPW27444.1 hypothetical protein ALO91_101742 [Pseudomonas syringae pv. aceris]KPW74701.1 hypothetical protein ALO78_101400 [Pseudomonas amygdali pv. ciccaronei]KPW85832.1 hypothetical protein ALO75_101727 [Pseudomonas syringae pv. coryli]KPX06639.1 hypothetical protein ALO74_101619 [Pseudomonas syringae pv. cunninghamiae]KPX90445.1 Uncharacterized protein ALO64_03506 [Pseudomonas meliae]KPY55991.1 hypothetical protein ALO4